jgi:hypothetical protein
MQWPTYSQYNVDYGQKCVNILGVSPQTLEVTPTKSALILLHITQKKPVREFSESVLFLLIFGAEHFSQWWWKQTTHMIATGEMQSVVFPLKNPI